MDKKTLKDIDLKGKKVVMRVDFNVPVKEGVIKDDTRIKGALASINYVLDNGGSLILMSHMGRPDEKGITGDTTMKIVAEYLSKMIGKEVKFAEDCGAADEAAAALKPGEILMLENTRYHKEEQAKLKQKDGQSDEEFKAAKAALKEQQKELAKKLASYGDVYCNDAFGTAHRAHASTAAMNIAQGVASKSDELYNTALNQYNQDRSFEYQKYADAIRNNQNRLNAINTAQQYKIGLQGNLASDYYNTQDARQSDLMAANQDRLNAQVGYGSAIAGLY